MQLPTIKSYGNYSSENYGVNSLMVAFPNGFILYYSYKTVIAFQGRKGLKVRQNSWQSTTGKHLNWIDGGGTIERKKRLEGGEFEKLLSEELEFHKLSA